MAADDPLAIRVDVRVSQGADGPKLGLACSDRTTVVPLSQLLSALRSLTNAVVDAAVERERSTGREVSCKAGCGACCRQLVPLSVTEARQLPQLIAGLDEAHRARVVKRFDEALAKLRTSGMLDSLERFATLSQHERAQLLSAYFKLGIPCPFLEEESCSIHAVRPVICRQFLVTSPPAHCADASAEAVVPVPIAANVLGALQRVEAHEPNPPRSVPLILALSLNLSPDDARKTVPVWMSLLLQQIQRIREERVGSGNSPEPSGCTD